MTRAAVAFAALGLAAGCAVEQSPLTRLTEALAEQTSSAAGPPVSASLLGASVLGDICINDDFARWEDVEVGGPAPIHPLLDALMGAPTVKKIGGSPADSFQLVLDGASLFGREGVEVQLETQRASESFTGTVNYMEYTDADGAIYFGHAALAGVETCTPQRSILAGTVSLTDTDDRQHTVTYGDGATATEGVQFSQDSPYLPVTGALKWSAQLSGEDRSFTTDDAATIEIVGDTYVGGDSGPVSLDNLEVSAAWPGTARGPTWHQSAKVPVVP